MFPLFNYGFIPRTWEQNHTADKLGYFVKIEDILGRWRSYRCVWFESRSKKYRRCLQRKNTGLFLFDWSRWTWLENTGCWCRI